MAYLAIKGHPTRGEEVIEILKMFGGVNRELHTGIADRFVYFIKDGLIVFENPVLLQNFICYTLEEFLENYQYKVGDKLKTIYGKVGIVSQLVWNYRENKVLYELKDDVDSLYHVDTELQPYKEESMKENKTTITFEYIVNDDNDIQLVIPDNIAIELRFGNILLRAKYPTTYEECCKLLNHVSVDEVKGYKDYLIENFQRLLVCRDAYWRLAVNWKYDVNKTEECFYIVNKCGRIVKEHYMNFNHILAFPTEEMRDAFYDNFKELIEKCKELL